ncbi:hypothetical protein NO122_001517 [Escherichia coli]|nr:MULTISPECIES: hypothetical protein [Escherichia]EHL2736817.1 hypothetical protein [Escherichia coli]EHL9187761.1 hypothetical protein [Escherichia coli]EHO9796709.1 hypothetical protein [Escherichia coli]EHP0854493.1 hypothetical protein [Escherichia coli]EHP6170020.1 hypothetical protein [Escherichia coli]
MIIKTLKMSTRKRN